MPSSKEMKRLATDKDLLIECRGPFSDSVIERRHQEYLSAPTDKFMRAYRDYLFTPATITIGGVTHEIQFNKCNNPFCKWYGLEQKTYDNIPYNPSRYRIVNTNVKARKSDIFCNPIEDPLMPGAPVSHHTSLVSNWSAAEEIKRLIKINTVVPVEQNYEFHRSGCPDSHASPIENPAGFYKRGKSTASSQKYQCKSCKKMTNVLPSIGERFNYNQKQNGVLVDFAKDILSRSPVRRTCEKLEIGASTYYGKLELLYKRSLEFLEYRESEALEKAHFYQMYLNTDAMIYHLNNVRQKSREKVKLPDTEDKKLPTYIITSSDSKSGYVFRSDVAYDSDFTFDQLERDTEKYRCDHTYQFLRKNERYRYPYYPQPPTKYDTSDFNDYYAELRDIEIRKAYVEGSHVKTNYTAMAHYWLLKQSVHADKWYFSSDDDQNIQSAIFKTFVDEIKSKESHYFVCQYDKSLTLKEAGRKYFETKNELDSWAKMNGWGELTTTEKARLWYEEFLSNYDLYQYFDYNGVRYPVANPMPFKSPISTKDEGIRWIRSITDTRSMSNEDLAKILVNIGNWSTNNYYQELRRRVSLLERPLTTARGDGKSYIYANYNPRYAQYLVTIFRTAYNFCWPKRKGKSPELLTPAQRLGIADKVYDIKDIIYFK